MDTELEKTCMKMIVDKLKATKAGATALSAFMIIRVVVETVILVPVLVTNPNPVLLRQYVGHLIQKLLEGWDGVVGTEDDVISQETADKLKTLVNEGILDDLSSMAYSLLHGDVASALVSGSNATSRCFLMCCFKPPKDSAA